MTPNAHNRLEFTTSNPQEAERWLRDAHPYYQGDFVDYVVQGVKDGVVRVRNPYFHKDGAGVVPCLGKDEADKWEEWSKPLLAMRDRDLSRIPQPIPVGPYDIEYGARVGIEYDESGNVTEEGHVMWLRGNEWGREFSIETALKGDRKLWSRRITDVGCVDIGETWIEGDEE